MRPVLSLCHFSAIALAACPLLAPYADGSGKLDNTQFFNVEHDNVGMGDITALFASNIFGGPAVTKEEFSSWQPGTFQSYALYVTAPTGEYNNDQVIPIGAMLSHNFGGLLAYAGSVSPHSDAADINTWAVRLQYV